MKHENLSESMYKEHNLEHYRSPSNFGNLKNATHEHTEYNSLCGDEITVQLLIKNGKIKDAKFSGSGCVISIVSASLLTDKIKEMNVKNITELKKEHLLKLLKIRISPARLKCVLLPMDAVKKALK